MRRVAAVAALGTVVAMLLPVAPASACSMPSGYFEADRYPFPAGSTVRLTGDMVADEDGNVPTCTMPPLPTATAEPSETGEPVPQESASAGTIGPSASESQEPAVTLPPLLPAAYAAANDVVVTLAPWREFEAPGPRREIGSLPADPVTPWGDAKDGLYHYTFAGRVTIPDDVVPGSYELAASQRDGASWGYLHVDVVAGLPQTGSPAVPLLQLGVLALVAGAGALLAARKA